MKGKGKGKRSRRSAANGSTAAHSLTTSSTSHLWGSTLGRTSPQVRLCAFDLGSWVEPPLGIEQTT